MRPSGNAVRHVLIRSISPSGPMPTAWPPAPWTCMFGEMISWASSYLPPDQPSSFQRRMISFASSEVDIEPATPRPFRRRRAICAIASRIVWFDFSRTSANSSPTRYGRSGIGTPPMPHSPIGTSSMMQ